MKYVTNWFSFLEIGSASKVNVILQDLIMTVEHIALAAAALGYGVFWIGAFDNNEVKKFLKIPGNLKVICLLPISILDENPSARPRKQFPEILSKEQYGAPLELKIPELQCSQPGIEAFILT